MSTAQGQTEIVPVGSEYAEIRIEKPSSPDASESEADCAFEFSFDIGFPCPQMTTTQGQTSIVPVGEESATLVLESSQGQGGCDFEFSF